MGRLSRFWLVLLVTLALVASGVTVAMAEELTQQIPQILGFGDGESGLAGEPSELEADGQVGEEESASEDPAGEEGAGDGSLADVTAEEPYIIEGDGFMIEVGPESMLLTIDGEEPLEIPLERTNNHGAFVSALAKAAPSGKGHGAIIRAMAQSTFGKDGLFDGMSIEDLVEGSSTDEVSEEDSVGSGEEFGLAASGSKNGKSKNVRASKSQKGGKKSGKK